LKRIDLRTRGGLCSHPGSSSGKSSPQEKETTPEKTPPSLYLLRRFTGLKNASAGNPQSLKKKGGARQIGKKSLKKGGESPRTSLGGWIKNLEKPRYGKIHSGNEEKRYQRQAPEEGGSIHRKLKE